MARPATKSWDRWGDSDESWAAFQRYRDETDRPDLETWAQEHGYDVGLVTLWAQERLWTERIQEFDEYRQEKVRRKAEAHQLSQDPLVADIALLQRAIIKDQLTKLKKDLEKSDFTVLSSRDMSAMMASYLKAVRAVERIQIDTTDDELDMSDMSLEEHKELQRLLAKARKRG